MATYNGAANAEAGANVSVLEWEHPAAAGENRVIFICLAGQTTTGAPNGVIAPTVGGNAATFVDAFDLAVGSSHHFEVWRYALPGSASATPTIYYDRGSTMQFPAGFSISAADVDLTDLIVDSDYTEGSDSPLVLSRTVDTVLDGLVVDFALYAARIGREPFVDTVGQTERAADTSGMSEGNNPPLIKGSTKDGTGDPVTMGWANAGGFQTGAMFVLSLRPASSGTEYEDAVEEVSEAGESVSAQLDTTGAITEAAEAGESTNGRLDMHASITAGAESGMSFDTDLSFDTEDEGAESGATFGATVTIPLSFTAGAVAGDEFEGVGDENKSIEDGAASGDTFGALMAALGSTTDGAESGDDYASILAGSGGWDAGAESGDGWEAHLTSSADWSAGASAGMALSTVAPPVETPLIVITRALRFTRFILRILRF